MKVRNLLENAIDANATRISLKSIAQHTGIDNALVSKFFAGKYELCFCDILDVTRFVAPAIEREVIIALVDDYIESPKPTNVRAALLYLVNHYMYDEMKLLGRSIPPAHRENRAWYGLIEKLAQHKQGDLVGYQLLTAIVNVHFDSAEYCALKSIVRAYSNYNNRDFKYIFDIAAEAEQYTKEIKNEFIRNSLYNSVAEILCHSYLFRRNDPKKCRFYAGSIRLSCLTNEVTRINNEYVTGISFIFEDFDQALAHLNSCVDSLTKRGDLKRASAIEQDDIAFLYSYWRKPMPQGSALEGSAQAYRYYIDGEIELAEAAIKEIGDTPFDLFVKGKVLNDEALLMASAMQYQLKGNEFFAALPAKDITSEHLKSVLKTKIA